MEAIGKDTIRLRDVLSDVPEELQGIFDICRNEISLAGDDLRGRLAKAYYASICTGCLLEFHNLSAGARSIIQAARKHLSASSTPEEASEKFEEINDKGHELRNAEFFLHPYEMKFADEPYDPAGVIRKVVENRLTGSDIMMAKTVLKRLMGAKVTVDRSRF